MPGDCSRQSTWLSQGQRRRGQCQWQMPERVRFWCTKSHTKISTSPKNFSKKSQKILKKCQKRTDTTRAVPVAKAWEFFISSRFLLSAVYLIPYHPDIPIQRFILYKCFLNMDLCDIQLYAWFIIVVRIQELDVGIIHNLKLRKCEQAQND